MERATARIIMAAAMGEFMLTDMLARGDDEPEEEEEGPDDPEPEVEQPG